MRAALYARVSTADQTTDNQLHELRQYADARGWTVTEYTDTISGARDRRPALDRLVKDARRRRVDVVIVWRLDRLGRSLKHLVNLLDELQAIGVSFISLNEGIDLGTPSGRLQLHVLSALAQFERERISERVLSGLARARRQGQTLGRPRLEVPSAAIEAVRGMPVRMAAKKLGISRSAAHRILSQKPA